MANRATTWLGLGAVGAVGYYFYAAGGDPKLAQKKAEADAAKLSSEVKSHLPGTTKEVQKTGEATLQNAKSRLSQAASDAKTEAGKVENKLEQYRADAAKQLDKTGRDVQVNATKAVDQFDKNVSEGAAKAKSGISGWFGGSK